jgi:hypothetical protein
MGFELAIGAPASVKQEPRMAVLSLDALFPPTTPPPAGRGSF